MKLDAEEAAAFAEVQNEYRITRELRQVTSPEFRALAREASEALTRAVFEREVTTRLLTIAGERLMDLAVAHGATREEANATFLAARSEVEVEIHSHIAAVKAGPS